MKSKTLRAVEEFVIRVLGVVFQVGGLFLIMGGLFLVSSGIFTGKVLTTNSLGVVFVTSGIAIALLGTLVFNDEPDHDEENLPPISTLPLPPYFARVGSTPLSGSLRTYGCPSCGYENHQGAFFCDACNSPVWPLGTPKGEPLGHATVEKRKMRIVARRKAIKILLFVMIAIIAAVPIWSSAVLGYTAVGATRLTMTVDVSSSASQLGTMDIVAVVTWSSGIPVKGEITNPAFTLSIAGGVVARALCPTAAIYGLDSSYACKIFTVAPSQYALDTVLNLSMETVLRFGLYQATVTRETSSPLYAPNPSV